MITTQELCDRLTNALKKRNAKNFLERLENERIKLHFQLVMSIREIHINSRWTICEKQTSNS